MAQKPQKLKSIQADLARQSAGAFNPLLQFFAQNAGLQLPATQLAAPVPQQPGFGTGARFQGAGPTQPAVPSEQERLASIFPVGGARQAPPQAGVLPDSALGIFGQGADALRFQQAEDDISRLARQRAQQLQFRLGQQGIGASGIGAAAQTQLQQSALQDLANFRRQLAIGAGQERERRALQLMQLLGLGLGQGAQAQGINLQQQQLAAQQPNFLQQLSGVAGAAGLFF